MATEAYWVWVDAGRPYVLALPIDQLREWAYANGFTVLGTIGDLDHLTADPPEDHTPFSATAYPVPLPGYVVTAIDIADERDLGAALLAQARAGKLPWLKYINTGGRHYTFKDGFKSSVSNPDTHNHLSIFSDWIDRSIEPFDPFGRNKDMGLKVITDGKHGYWETDGITRWPIPADGSDTDKYAVWGQPIKVSNLDHIAPAADGPPAPGSGVSANQVDNLIRRALADWASGARNAMTDAD